jgi:murein DD-endopeptidase MepM/ murein hydrolase activator NlpD
MASPATSPAAFEPVRVGGASRMALELLLEEGELQPAERLTTEEAIDAFELLTSTLGDEHSAAAALVLGPTRWRIAMDHALARQAHTGSGPMPISELDARERREVLEAWEVFDRRREHLTFAWPIEEPCRVSSRFGPRIHPILRRPLPHDGIDLAVPTGTPVRAAQAGEVVATRSGGASGRTVVIDHGDGLVTSYFHLDEQLVKKGAVVERGQPIARSGATGRVTGAHLHFVVELDGVPIDPALLRP